MLSIWSYGIPKGQCRVMRDVISYQQAWYIFFIALCFGSLLGILDLCRLSWFLLGLVDGENDDVVRDLIPSSTYVWGLDWVLSLLMKFHL